MKKSIIAIAAIAAAGIIASCSQKKQAEVDTVNIENDSTTIIVTEDTTVKVDTVKTVETVQAPASDSTAR